MIDCRFRPLERWPREKTSRVEQRWGAYKASFPDTLDLLEKELNYLSAKNIVIEIDLPLSKIRNDGWPHSSATPDFSGVILSFDSRYGALSVDCDHFKDWRHNLRAIAMHLYDLRHASIYGVGASGEQYKGWTGLPAAGTTRSSEILAAEFFSMHAGAASQEYLNSSQLCEQAYRQLVNKWHPDKNNGQTHPNWDQLQQAVAALRQYHAAR